MFHYIHLALVFVTTPITGVYVVCSVSLLALLRVLKLHTSEAAARISAEDVAVDLSDRTVIVTGANTGEYSKQHKAAEGDPSGRLRFDASLSIAHCCSSCAMRRNYRI